MPTAQDFRDRLRIELENAEKRREPYLVVTAGELYDRVASRRGSNHRMRNCCRVMIQEKREGDEVLPGGPPSCQGPRFAIRYALPR